MLAKVQAVANLPLKPLPPIDRGTLEEQIYRFYAALPKQSAGQAEGVFQVEAYVTVLAGLSLAQVEFMVDRVLRTCEWLPAPAKCLRISEEFQRTDASVQVRARAEALARREMQARFDDTFAALERGELDADAIAALPERWITIAETRGLIWRFSDGTFEPRPRHRPVADASEGDPSSEDSEDLQAEMSEKFPSQREAA